MNELNFSFDRYSATVAIKFDMRTVAKSDDTASLWLYGGCKCTGISTFYVS